MRHLFWRVSWNQLEISRCGWPAGFRVDNAAAQTEETLFTEGEVNGVEFFSWGQVDCGGAGRLCGSRIIGNRISDIGFIAEARRRSRLDVITPGWEQENAIFTSIIGSR